MNTKFNSIMSKILVLALVLTIALSQVGTFTVSAQSANPPSVTTYDQLPQKGQMIIPANTGWVAPKEWNGLNVTIWYGVREDTVTSMGNLGNGLAKDRAKLYGGTSADYPTVVWTGNAVALSGGNNCRPEFYSDSAIMTAGVVYGDECPLLIEYNAEGHFIAAPVVSTSTPLPTFTPTATATLVFTPTPSVEASVTPSAQPSPTATNNPDVVFQKDVTLTNNGLQWFAFLVLLALVLFLAFRRPSAPQDAPVAPKAAAPRRKPATKKKTRK